jgi:hypothetical protein
LAAHWQSKTDYFFRRAVLLFDGFFRVATLARDFLGDFFFFPAFALIGFAASFLAGFLAGLRTDLTRAGVAFLLPLRRLLPTTGRGVSSLSEASSSRQPWASLTAIMLERMLFQVSCFIITALGNMQPSQQI